MARKLVNFDFFPKGRKKRYGKSLAVDERFDQFEDLLQLEHIDF